MTDDQRFLQAMRIAPDADVGGDSMPRRCPWKAPQREEPQEQVALRIQEETISQLYRALAEARSNLFGWKVFAAGLFLLLVVSKCV